MGKIVKSVVLTAFVLALVTFGQYSNKPDYYGQTAPISETVNV